MLTRVTVGQVRFNLAGLSVDSRGVAAGKELLIRFVSLDRVVGFLRLLSAERTPDELWSSLSIVYARPAAGGREMIVRLAHPGGEIADLVASCARLAGGSPHTGTGRVFVPMRESRAPLGYDVAAVPSDEGDFCLVGTDGTTPFRQEGTLPFERLLLRLELRREPGGALATLEAGRAGGGDFPVIVSARRGLAPMLLQLLFREGVQARAAIVEPKDTGPFGSGHAVTWLFRIPGLPARLGAPCARTPGLRLYVPVLDDVLVEAGWQHPIHLAGARAALTGDRLLLLSAPPVSPLEVWPRPSFVDLADLVGIDLGAASPAPAAVRAVATVASPPEPGKNDDALVVPLRLEPLRTGTARVRAALVPWAQAPWVRRVLFALPAVALRSTRVAFVEAGVLVLGAERLEGFPFGQPLEEPQPGLLVPAGMRLRPALSPELLAQRLGIVDGALCVFPDRDAAPFRVPPTAFEPLERKALSRTDLPWASPPGLRTSPPLASDPSAPPEIENRPLGLLPLWGWRP
ncbi:MAG TPA: hypothetical protein VGG33_07695 [Polyangia bacterium]